MAAMLVITDIETTEGIRYLHTNMAAMMSRENQIYQVDLNKHR